MANGLEGVVAATTRLSHVDGEAGRLILAGYAVEDLAPRATFEEVTHLLLFGRLPDEGELDRFGRVLAEHRGLTPIALSVLRHAAAAGVPAIDALRMATPLLSLGHPEHAEDDALRAIAAFPVMVGSYWRMCGGQDPVPVRADLSHAAHYLYQLSGEEPSADRVRVL